MQTVQIDGEHLTIDEIVAVARHGARVTLSPSAIASIQQSHKWVEEIIERDEPVYGINTGFGVFAEKRIPKHDFSTLSRNLILSHAVATGTPFDEEIVRAAMLVRANTLAKGYSGVRVEVVETLLALLNQNVTPVIPSQGSLGSSGDLAPLAHMTLVFSTDDEGSGAQSGFASYQGEIIEGKEAMASAGIKPIILGAKEGLALTNGATFTAAIGALAVYDAEILLRTGELSLTLSLEALMGCTDAFDERLHKARGFQGQARVAEAVRRLVRNSTLLNKCGLVQDAYSLRCAPQVQGICWDTLEFVKNVIDLEINAATDNPLLFEPGIALSGGNFHGEPVGLAMDYLGIAMAELASISERRTYRLTDGNFNSGLPPMLVDQPEDAGLNSGMMMPQYTAASLVLENRTLATPDSIQSLPVSGQKEDHNANSTTAARHARDIIKNTAHVLAIELYTAARALDLRLRQYPEFELGEGTQRVYKTIRNTINYQPGDAWWAPEIDQVRELILSEVLED